MEWLWLLIMLVALVLLWFAIIGVERLIRRVKNKDVIYKKEAATLEKKIDEEETNFIKKEAARNFIETAPLKEKNPPQEYFDAMNLLTADELLDSVCLRMFGNKEENEKKIIASKSAFEKEPEAVAVASGNGMLPIKTKSSTKPSLSKEEKKLLDKIKQGS